MPYFRNMYIDDVSTTYYIHVCQGVLLLRSSGSGRCLRRIPFHNCCNPTLIRHNRLLILVYLEHPTDSDYYVRFRFPLQEDITVSPELKYTDKPSYAIYVLENELFLSIMHHGKFSICHLRFDRCGHSYSLRRLRFYNG